MHAARPARLTARLRRIGYCLLPLGAGVGAALLLLLAANRPARAGNANQPAGLLCGATIQACIDTASPGSTVFIPAGDYTESLTLSKAVSLTGALSSTTILHALANTRVLTVTGAAVDSSVVISGLTFTGGNLPGFFGSCPELCGGGVLITGSAQPRLSNVRLIGNTAVYGAGLYASGDLTVSDSGFLSNVVGSMIDGGGLYVGGAATVYHSSFINNYANSGGGLYATDATVFASNFVGNQNGGLFAAHGLTVTDSNFVDNYTDNLGGGIQAAYGASAMVSGSSFVGNYAANGGGLGVFFGATVSGSSFIHNIAANGGNGGGVSAGWATVSASSFISNNAGYGGGLYVNGPSAVSGSSFVSNTSCFGGGLFAYRDATLSDSRFISNTSCDGGGGVFALGRVTATTTSFIGNFGGTGTGGLFAWGATLTGTQFISNSAQAFGGLRVVNSAEPSRVVNSLFTRNRSAAGGADVDGLNTSLTLLYDTFADPGLAPGVSVYVTGGNLGITDTVFASQTIAIEGAGGSVFQDYNLFFGNGTNISGTSSGGAHSLTGDPAFRDPAHDDYHITVSSAARHKGIDVGVATDFEGDPRPFDGAFDIGFDQYLAKLFVPLVRR